MRGVLMFLNILFVIVGLTLTGIGIYIKIDNNFASILNDLAKNDTDFSSQSLGFLAFVMIGGGVVTLLIALFGCVGEFSLVSTKNRDSILLCRSSMGQSMSAVHVCRYPSHHHDYRARWIHHGVCLQSQAEGGLH